MQPPLLGRWNESSNRLLLANGCTVDDDAAGVLSSSWGIGLMVLTVAMVSEIYLNFNQYY